MTPTDEIDDPNWNDIFDRDKEIKKLRDELALLKSSTTEIFEDREGLRKIVGRGPFALERVSKDRWVVSLNDERVELYNRKGRRVRGIMNPAGDGEW
jgi:hypothetical protein